MADRTMTHALLETGLFRRLLSGLARRRSGERLLRQLGRHHAVYESFADAWAAAADGRHAGHDHPDSLNYLLELSTALRPSDYAALYWLGRKPEALRIFDYGGSVGNLFYSYRPYLPSPEAVSWTVYDLPKFVEDGRRLAAERGVTGQLSFADSLGEAAGADLLLASGSLHYWEGSVAELFDQFGARPGQVIVNRTPMHETEPSFITIQRFDNFAVPCRVRNVPEFIADFERLGYRLVNRWRALELSIVMPLFPDKSVPFYSGFYFRRD